LQTKKYNVRVKKMDVRVAIDAVNETIVMTVVHMDYKVK
jgi:hypothetical protein